MTTRDHGSAATPDVTTMIDDDLLLDRLGRDEAPPGDPAAALLADWRAGLPDGEEPDERLTAAAVAATRPSRLQGRWTRRAVAATAATALLGGGMAVAAEHARPGNPLWPVTEWLYPNLAGSRAAADAASGAVAEARAALAAGHPENADRLLTRATALAERVTEPAERARLLSDIAALRTRTATPTDLPPVPGEVPIGTTTVPVPTSPVEQAVPPADTPSAVQPPPPQRDTPEPTPSAPDLPTDTSLPLPTLPLDPPLPGH